MPGLTPKMPSAGGARVRMPRPTAGEAGPKFQRGVMAPTKFPRVSPARRDYAKGAAGAENPLGFSEGSKSNFGQTGLTGES
jgi:hypothetical protein